MKQMFPEVEIRLHGEPADIGGARALALQDRYDFQYWALTLVGARPVDDARGKPKKGADKGIDGTISFLGENQKTPHHCIVQVKSGHVNRETVGALRGTVERERAELGLLITLEEPTGPMRTEALEAGFYHSAWMEQDYPRIQIVTIGELLHGQQPKIPPRYNPYRLADFEKKPAQQTALFEREG
jgi:site-specific DNA-methyltransferase (adenine-specific)